jgi:BspA type Leucine rich repeat region (6 copies)
MKTTIQKLILSLVWLALPMLAQAQFDYMINSGAVTITGYTGSGGTVVIPAATNGYPITSIGIDAFFNTPLTSVTIPDSVTSIEDYAFNTCHSLTRVTIGNNVVSIGIEAFYNCNRLTSTAIPDSVTNIGDEAFSDCPHLTSETIPNSVTSIGDEAFSECSGLTNVVIGNSITSLREFSECIGLTGVTIGNSVTSIGDEAFEYCSALTSVTIPNSVTNIGEVDSSVDTAGPFQFCIGLTNVIIGNSVTAIGNGAFLSCSNLTRVTIPNSVTNIGFEAFYDCTNLTAAYFSGNAPPDSGNAFDSDPAIVYYLSETTGWGPTFGGVPTMLWNPQAIAPGFTGGQFGFNLTGPTNAAIVVEACTNLSNPIWLPIATNTFSASGTSTFNDPSSGGQPSRFYRFSSP